MCQKGTTVVCMSQTVAELGEFALIAAVAQRLGTPDPSTVPLGIGDDSAVVIAAGGHVVACVDVLNEGVHFRTDWSSPNDVGHKAAAANLADIFAMGADPTALLVGLSIPESTQVQWVLDFADGLAQEAALVGAHVVGGDIVRGDKITISVTALGQLDNRQAILRSGAQVNDVVAVAGRLGYSAAGLQMLQRGFRSPRNLVNAHRAPTPPYDLAKLGRQAHSMIDVSDGLVSDLGHIASASGVAIDISTAQFTIPEELTAAAGAFHGDALQWILSGGEDHAFAATFKDALSVPSGWNIIGHVTMGSGVTVDGQSPQALGWDHFAK